MTLTALIRKRDTGGLAKDNPAKAANDGPEGGEPLAGLATLALASPASEEIATFRRWRVRFPNLDPAEVIFTPEATRAEVAAIYPGAMIEALSDPPRRQPTEVEVAELRELVAVILPDEAERADVLRVACADPEAALISFRLLAAEARERAICETGR
jgi:hypothetical protein